MVTILLPALLRPHAGGATSVEVEGATAGEAFEALFARHPGLRAHLLDPAGRLPRHLLAFVGDRPLSRAQWASAPLQAGDTVRLLVAVGGGEDVRMRGFRRRVSVEVARAAALSGVAPLPAEEVALAEAAGRVAAEAIRSEVHVPPFARATMDGYALRAADTFGATAYGPVVLALAGEALPGRPAAAPVGAGTACRIMTGAPLPEGADAVLRAEDATEGPGIVEVRVPVPGGRHVGLVGEDVRRGDEVVPAGRRLLPQDVGLLSSVGRGALQVHRRPRVRLIVSGDELLPAGSVPSGASIADSNGPMLAALVARDGGLVEGAWRLRDDRDEMRAALAQPGADAIVTAGAVSVGKEDWVPLLVAELGELAVHGVAMRPSSPTGIGRIRGVPVLLLPGNPVSCLVAYDFFAGPVVRRLGGLPEEWPYSTATLPLASRLASQIGRTDYARVRVRSGAVEPVAVGGASVLSSVAGADGFVVVPEGSEGFPAGEPVAVHLYRPLPASA